MGHQSMVVNPVIDLMRDVSIEEINQTASYKGDIRCLKSLFNNRKGKIEKEKAKTLRFLKNQKEKELKMKVVEESVEIPPEEALRIQRYFHQVKLVAQKLIRENILTSSEMQLIKTLNHAQLQNEKARELLALQQNLKGILKKIRQNTTTKDAVYDILLAVYVLKNSGMHEGVKTTSKKEVMPSTA